MDLPIRKPLRLKEFDYSSPGAYFITICTHERKCILSDITASAPEDGVGALHEAPAVRLALTPEGECVRRILENLSLRFPEIFLDHFVIMPNHIHLLLRIEGDRAIHESPLPDGGKRSLLSKAIGYLKMNSTREIRRMRPDETIWQRSFFDHIVRNESDHRQITEYIAANPARWAEDRFHP